MLHVSELNRQLTKHRRELARLEAALLLTRKRVLPNLYAQVGAESTDELISLLLEYASPSFRDALMLENKGSRGRKARMPISPGMRRRVINDLKNSRKTAALIAQSLNISTSAVNKIKQQAGLTKQRTIESQAP